VPVLFVIKIYSNSVHSSPKYFLAVKDRVAESEVKYPTQDPTFPKFPTPTFPTFPTPTP